MKQNNHLLAVRGVINKINEKGYTTKISDEKLEILSNMPSFEVYTENIDTDFFSKTINSVFKDIKKESLFNISYITYSIKGNGYWRIYLILKEEKSISEIGESDKLKELYLKTNKQIFNQKTRRKTCRSCSSVIDLDAFFNNRKFKYRKHDEAIKCPVCGSSTGFYSKTIQERISKIKEN